MSTSVKHIHNGMRGAPALSGTAGTLAAVLNALFVTGWGPTTALSVNVAGGIATATLTPGETFDRDAVVLVAGATPAALNGEARVVTTSNNSITWTTTAPDGAATGAITIRYAPQTSWSEAFAATNKRAYRSTHVQSAGHYYRLDDTGTVTARLRGYETMTDVDNGTGPFPTDAQMSGGGYIHKSTSANATSVKYKIVCDQRFVILAIAGGTSVIASANGAPPRGFGDPIALAPGGDAWASLVSAAGSNSSSLAQGSLASNLASSGSGFSACPRPVSALGGSVLVDPRGYVSTAGAMSGVDGTLGPFPSEVDGQLKTSRIFMKETGSKPPRLVVPGVYYIPQSGALGPIVDGDTLDGAGELVGRRLLAVPDVTSLSAGPNGLYLIDITGPWR